MGEPEQSSVGGGQSVRERTPRYLRLFTDSVSIWILGSSLVLVLGAPVIFFRTGYIDLLALYLLFVLIGGPLSLVYLWPVITEKEHRRAMANQLQPLFSRAQITGIVVVAAAQVLLIQISVTTAVLVNTSIGIGMFVVMVLLVPVIIRDWVQGE